jgi:transcription antitermination factor NusG
MPDRDEGPRWYVVHTYSGYENKVKDNLEKSIENNNMQDRILEIRIPVEEVVEIKGGKRRIVQRKIYPGYVMVKMVMTDDTWYIVRWTMRRLPPFISTTSSTGIRISKIRSCMLLFSMDFSRLSLTLFS